MLIDTHCHLDFARFDDDRDAVWSRAVAAGVTRLIIPAIDLDNCRTIQQLAAQYAGVYTAVGIHPNSTAAWQDNWIAALRHLAQHAKVVAIGEIGLDYYWDSSPKPVQQRALAMQLELAAELNLPVIIHNREASADVLRLLSHSSLAGKPNPGVLHSFAADADTAQAALAMGYYLGFTGPLTYKKAHELRTIAAQVPLDRLLVETDAPFLAPQAHRGQRNEPAYVGEVAAKLAELHGRETAVIAQQTTANACRLFSRLNRVA